MSYAAVIGWTVIAFWALLLGCGIVYAIIRRVSR